MIPHILANYWQNFLWSLSTSNVPVVVLLFIFIIFLLTKLFPRQLFGFRSRRRQRFFESVFVIFLGTFAIGCGFWGHFSSTENPADSVNPTGVESTAVAPSSGKSEDDFWKIETAFYQALQLISFDGDLSSPNPAIMFAVVCSVLLAFIVASEALQKLFHNSFLTLYLSLSFLPRTVICGLGHVGSQLMEDLGNRRTLVIVEKNPENIHLERAREMGAIIIQGDARSEKLLKSVGAHFAKEVFLTTGNDEVNAEAILDIADLLKQQQSSNWKRLSAFLKRTPKIYMQLNHANVAKMLRESSLIKESGLQDRLNVFNAVEAAAENFVTETVIQHRPQNHQVNHYVFYGFNQMGQRLALKIAELAHFDNLKRSRMTILYSEEEQVQVDAFRIQYPHFGPSESSLKAAGVAGWEFPKEADHWGSQCLRPEDQFEDGHVVEYAINADFWPQPVSILEQSFLNQLKTLSDDPSIVPMLILCIEGDTASTSQADELQSELLQQRIDMPLFLWIPNQPQIANMIRSCHRNRPGELASLQPFGECHTCCSYDAISKNLKDELANAFYVAYEVKYGTPAERIPPLSSLTDDFSYWSNFSAALHTVFKLDVLGLEVMKLKQANQDQRTILSESEIQTLISEKPHEVMIAEMEHNRWMAERLLRGWKYEGVPEGHDPYSKDEQTMEKWKAFKKQMTARKTRHLFIPYDDLHENEGVKDKTQVEVMLKYCSGQYDNKFAKEKLCLVKKV
ncbi:NAD(P)-binding protein [Rubinisphaera sp.]|uniref:NAD(P)-binding protein n=1 Tax=Rubinisphaera sp. TaxID=2024857 RepID=UPI000C0F09E7|nr:NAD(P)-binding protein [Rubinisphaera sp.]MBV09899.1 hypothetical protein [Rubinisphaera sp.]HCS51800.1 hypothetical protein [Planctomycetaceae bacterium]|tara:strand:- start:763 stop:2973 length:2211 start_codon:yes stop_codon:yes gene_type:complete